MFSTCDFLCVVGRILSYDDGTGITPPSLIAINCSLNYTLCLIWFLVGGLEIEQFDEKLKSTSSFPPFWLASLLFLLLFQIGLCIGVSCVGVSIVWSAMMGILVLKRIRQPQRIGRQSSPIRTSGTIRRTLSASSSSSSNLIIPSVSAISSSSSPADIVNESDGDGTLCSWMWFHLFTLPLENRAKFILDLILITLSLLSIATWIYYAAVEAWITTLAHLLAALLGFIMLWIHQACLN